MAQLRSAPSPTPRKFLPNCIMYVGSSWRIAIVYNLEQDLDNYRLFAYIHVSNVLPTKRMVSPCHSRFSPGLDLLIRSHNTANSRGIVSLGGTQ